MAACQIEHFDNGVFGYTDLPAELQQMILEDVLFVAQEDEYKLSRLTIVNREWQKRVEMITFASLGEFPSVEYLEYTWGTPGWNKKRSPFRAIHLSEFESFVVDARRANLRSIAIDFNVDEGGMPELGGLLASSLDNGTLIHDTRTRRSHRFDGYMRDFFRILHAWAAINAAPSYLDVKIRVCGLPMPHMRESWPRECNEIPIGVHELLREDFTSLPYVSAIHSFELINDFREEPNYCHYVPLGSLNKILSRLPLLRLAAINVEIPSQFNANHFNENIVDPGRNQRQLAANALVDLPGQCPAKLAELVLKNSPNDHLRMGNCSLFHGGCFESISFLGQFLESLTLDYVLRIDRYMDYLSREKACHWPHMKRFVMKDHIADQNWNKLFPAALVRKFIIRLPMLETLDIKLVRGHEWLDVSPDAATAAIKAEYVKNPNDDDYMLLSSCPPLTAQEIGRWESTIRASRGVPTRISTLEWLPQQEDSWMQGEDGASGWW